MTCAPKAIFHTGLLESVAYRSLQERVVQVGKPDALRTLQAKRESQVIGPLEVLTAQD